MKGFLSQKFLHAVYGLAGILLVSLVLLWSWNTLSVLFEGPVAQYKHAVAALAVAWILGWAMRFAFRHNHRSRFTGPGREA